MDFVSLFSELAKHPQFEKKVAEAFQAYCVAKKIPADAKRNHELTWKAASSAGAGVLAEIIGETMAKHPFLAKQAMKMMEGS